MPESCHGWAWFGAKHGVRDWVSLTALTGDSVWRPGQREQSDGTAAGVRIGIDIGGTFTDFLLIDSATGGFAVHKALTTPDDPSEAVLNGLRTLLGDAGVDPTAITQIVHGTTLVTNALIERKGAITGLMTTRGSGTRSRSGASIATICTTSSSICRNRSCRATCASKLTSACSRTDRFAGRSPWTRFRNGSTS